MIDDHATKDAVEQCVVCGKPIADGEGRYRLPRGSIHVACAKDLPAEDERKS